MFAEMSRNAFSWQAMLYLALGKVEKKERNMASSFSNIFVNVGL